MQEEVRLQPARPPCRAPRRRAGRCGGPSQVERVARERGVPASEVERLVAGATVGRDLGVLGAPWVNVLELDLALDRELPWGPCGPRRPEPDGGDRRRPPPRGSSASPAPEGASRTMRSSGSPRSVRHRPTSRCSRAPVPRAHRVGGSRPA
ncbi:potassium-transporting ATPase subunit C [Geodermatophilus sp. SYSU D00697]